MAAKWKRTWKEHGVPFKGTLNQSMKTHLVIMSTNRYMYCVNCQLMGLNSNYAFLIYFIIKATSLKQNKKHLMMGLVGHANLPCWPTVSCLVFKVTVFATLKINLFFTSFTQYFTNVTGLLSVCSPTLYIYAS